MKGKDPNFRNVTNVGKEEEQDDFGQVRAPFFLPTKTDETDVRNSAFVVEMNDDDKDGKKNGDDNDDSSNTQITTVQES